MTIIFLFNFIGNLMILMLNLYMISLKFKKLNLNFHYSFLNLIYDYFYIFYLFQINFKIILSFKYQENNILRRIKYNHELPH